MSEEEKNSNEEEAPKEEAPKAASNDEGDHGYPGNHGYHLNNMVVNSHLAGKPTTPKPNPENDSE